MIITMLHILLLILKFIGILLGALLALFLCLIGLALFVPVRYQLNAVRTEGEGNPPVDVRVKITWLLHFVNVRICYPSEVYLRVRLFILTIFRLPPKEKKPSKSRKAAKGKKASKKKKESREEKTSENQEGAEDKGNYKIQSESEGNVNFESEKSGAQSAYNTEAAGASQTDAEPGIEKPKTTLKEKILKICEFFQNIWYTIKGICDRIREIFENIEYYWEVLQSDTFQQSYALCKDEIGSVLAHIRPRKFQADLVIGMDDPAATGKILSYYGILYPIVGNHVTITGDFERKRIEGVVYMKGRVRLFTLLTAAARIYFNKDIRKLLKLFKKEDNVNGR